MFRNHVYLYPSRRQNSRISREKWLYQQLNDISKRVFDIFASAIGLLILSPLFLIIAILIKRDSPGPVFYWGYRVGKKGRIFRILKFRTMYERKESYEGPCLTCDDDSRITPFGRWLRDTKINELPQLWNVLKGEMSLVGPRPEAPEIVKDWYPDAIEEILSVAPGITSPASIIYHDEEHLLTHSNLMNQYLTNLLPDKVRLDRLYVHNHSFFSDLDIIFYTLILFVPRLAKVKVPEGYLFAGPITRIVNRNISWFIGDFLISLVSVSVSGLIWRSMGPFDWGRLNMIMVAFFLSFLFSGLNALTGLNRVVWSQAAPRDAMYLVVSSYLVTLLIVVVNYFSSKYYWLPYPALPYTMFFVIGFFNAFGFTIIRYRTRLMTGIASRWIRLRQSALFLGERVLIIGTGECAQVASFLLSREAFRNAFNVVGMVECFDPTKHHMKVSGLKVLGGIGDLPALIEQYNIGVIFFAVTNIEQKVKQYILKFCDHPNVRVVFFDQLLEGLYDQITQPILSDINVSKLYSNKTTDQ